jgi:hypothetical protein
MSEVSVSNDPQTTLLGLELPEITTRFYSDDSSGQSTEADIKTFTGADIKTFTVNKNTMLLIKDPALDPKEQNDVDLSNLVAQLNSDRLFNAEEQAPQWFENYRKVLSKVCYWVIHGLEFQKYHSQEATFSLDKVAVETLLNILAGAPVEKVKAAVQGSIDKLRQLAAKGDPAANLFGTGKTGAKGAKVIIGYAYPGQSGPRLKLAAFYFKTDEHVTNALFFNIRSRDIDVWYATAEMEQSTNSYATPKPPSNKSQRELVRCKIGDRAEKELAVLEI